MSIIIPVTFVPKDQFFNSHNNGGGDDGKPKKCHTNCCWHDTEGPQLLQDGRYRQICCHCGDHRDYTPPAEDRHGDHTYGDALRDECEGDCCFHDSGEVLTIAGGIYKQKCCHCGKRNDWRGVPKRDRHGKFLPELNTS